MILAFRWGCILCFADSVFQGCSLGIPPGTLLAKLGGAGSRILGVGRGF